VKLFVASTAVIAFGLTTPAAAYVPTRTSSGTALQWRRSCPMFVFEADENPAFDHDRLRRTFENAAAAWRVDFESCTHIPVEVERSTTANRQVAFDGTQAILWREPGYCDEDPDSELCLSPNAAAVTSVFFYDKPGEPEDGEILEVDMELNAMNYAFSDDGAPDRIDMPSVITHELGHVFGFDHTCYTIRGGVIPRDDAGHEVPYCFPTADLGPDVTTATMYNFLSAGETTRRQPREDERSALCATYADHDGSCEPIEPGCSCRSGRERPPLVVAVLTIAALFSRSRRRRKR
jgi:MYXO-CTERM domain-containing protein